MAKMIEGFLTATDWIYNTMRQARLAQRAYEELSSLTDRELQDLGITRADIVRIAFQTQR